MLAFASASESDLAQDSVLAWDDAETLQDKKAGRPMRHWIGVALLAVGLGIGLAASLAWPG